MFEERIAAMNQRTEEAMAANAVQFDKRTYTVDEIQDILGISRTSAYNLVKKKVFHSVRIGGSIRISKICSFIEKYILPYLYTYRFYKEYGIYPYGERSHGTMGDLEYLKDLFGVNDWKQVFDIMIFVIRFPYRGHLLCPCGSGEKIRNCHGNVLRKVMDAKLQDEFILILLEIEKVFEREAEKWKM